MNEVWQIRGKEEEEQPTTAAERKRTGGDGCQPSPPPQLAKRYIGLHLWDGTPFAMVQAIYSDGRLALAKGLSNRVVSLDLEAELIALAYHGPIGFSWGDDSSGSAQLALAILADYLGDDELGLRLYQQFQSDVISRFIANANFVLVDRQIDAWLAAVAQRKCVVKSKPFGAESEDSSRADC